MIQAFSVHDRALSMCYRNSPLVIAGCGPSWKHLRLEGLSDVTVFALNHAITELYQREKTWWVSNDHDRTFSNPKLLRQMEARLARYSPWYTITQKKFLPGKSGDFEWFDHRGQKQKPMTWRLAAPDNSLVAFYNAGKFMRDFPDWVHNGETVLELALEVATLWGFSPVVLFGCDLGLDSLDTYYAEPFRWKDTPRKIRFGKLDAARESVVKNRARWCDEVYIVTDHWPDAPFEHIGPEEALEKLEEAQWSRT